MDFVLAVRINHDGKALATAGVQTLFNGNHRTADGAMYRCADKACRFAQHLTHFHIVAHLHHGIGRCAQMHGKGNHNLLGSGEFYKCQVLCAFLALHRVNTAVVTGVAAFPLSLYIFRNSLVVYLGIVTKLYRLTGQLCKATLTGKSFLNLCPGAVLGVVHFALAVLGTAALAVYKALGAIHHRADTAGNI